jgi:hypothetical protein
LPAIRGQRVMNWNWPDEISVDEPSAFQLFKGNDTLVVASQLQ